MICRICNHKIQSNPLFIKEKMFGTYEMFKYLICQNCKCIQIVQIPEDLTKYYPKDYYSFHNTEKEKSLKQKIKHFVLYRYSLLLGEYYRKPDFVKFGMNLKDRQKKVLDIGCGNGKLLFEMKENGFKALTGIDPFIDNEIHERSINIFKQSVTEHKNTGRKYDIILSHHSLEHMPDPNEFFHCISPMLEDKGKLILRIPIYPNYIWDKYQLDWIQLDAPRHLYTFHLDTIKYLCAKNKLEIIQIEDDSQPWALASTKYCLNGESHKSFEKTYKQNISHVNEHIKGLYNNVGDTVQLTIKHKNA